MDFLVGLEVQRLFELINVVLTSGIVIFSFAIFFYLLIYRFQNDVARSFAFLLGCVLLTYFADLALFGVESPEVAEPWLRVQWVGIAFTPAAYLTFSNALLATTGARSRMRDLAVWSSYFASTAVLAGVGFTDLVVREYAVTYGAAHLLPGPLLWVFVVYFAAGVLWGTYNVFWARSRCLTSTSRRRMAYLAATIAAPAAGVFPYLLLLGWPTYAPSLALWWLLVLGNVGVGLMLILLAYSVAFFGALTPDRVIKHRMVRFLLRGPLLSTLVVVVILIASRAEGWLGLTSQRVTMFLVVLVILLLQLGIEFAKPLIDRALYRRDMPEIRWIQNLSRRLLTTTDLHQFLENVLTALCDLLRVDAAFVAVIDGGRPRLEVVCGSFAPPEPDELPTAAWRSSSGEGQSRHVERFDGIFVWDGYWLAPLYAKEGKVVVGMVGMAARSETPDLTSEEQEGMEALLTQAAVALEDRQLQQGIFGVLEQIIPEIEDIQRRRGMVHYVGEDALSGFDPTQDPEFRQWVWDALSHYWGGPKLMSSPLLDLRIVERAVGEHGGNVIQGLRAVLKQAVEQLRPDGSRKMTTPEWLLYNILELKFLQGRKVREVALRLAMSESDLYRKQRVAIEAVAQILAQMEQEELEKG